MNIGIHLSNHLESEAIYQLLVKNGYDHVVTSGRPPTNGFTPHVLLVDITTLKQDLLSQYADAKVLLIDTGMEPEQLCATLLSYRIHGILSPDTELDLFKKALTVISEGKLWIDNGAVKALLDGTGAISKPGKVSGVTDREKEIIELVCQGWGNKEIAGRLTLSPHTVRTHLNNIFRKFNVTSRTKLMSLATHRPREVSV